MNTTESVEEVGKWGLPLMDLYRLALSFYKQNAGKAVHLSYEDNLKLIAYKQQASCGPFDAAHAPELGVLDVIGKDRRLHWMMLGNLDREKAMEGFIDLLETMCSAFRPYVEAVKKNRDETLKADLQRLEAEKVNQENNERKQQELLEEDYKDEIQRRQLQDALNRQTYQQFKSYAEKQFPGNPEQQAVLIHQLQKEHYHQYMQQLHLHNQNAAAATAAGGATTTNSSISNNGVTNCDNNTTTIQNSDVSNATATTPTTTSVNNTIMVAPTTTTTAAAVAMVNENSSSSGSKSNYVNTNNATNDVAPVAGIDTNCLSSVNDARASIQQQEQQQLESSTTATATTDQELLEQKLLHQNNDDDDYVLISPARIWTRPDIVEFKAEVSAGDGDGVITIGHGDTVTVRVPTNVSGKCIFWEFATDSYDIGFGVFFEWCKPLTSEVTVHVSDSDDDDDCIDEDYLSTTDDLEVGSVINERNMVATQNTAAAASMKAPVSIIVPIYRRECFNEVYVGSHEYPGEGVYLLKFDNSYSIWRSKTLYYRVYYER